MAAGSLQALAEAWRRVPQDVALVGFDDSLIATCTTPPMSSVHQPVEKAPGLSLGGLGQFFTRLESWAGQAKDWVSYIARCSYLLQQGQAVAASREPTRILDWIPTAATTSPVIEY